MVRGVFLYLADEYHPDIPDKKFAEIINRERSTVVSRKQKVSAYFDSQDKVVTKAIETIKRKIEEGNYVEITLGGLVDGDLMTLKRMLFEGKECWQNMPAIKEIDAEVTRRLMLNNK
jgi:hypothetical protein